MRLVSAEAIPYALPFREPYVTARGVLERREMVLLRLRDEEGRLGLGEAVPLSLRGGAALAAVVAELESLRDLTGADGASVWTAAATFSAPARCAVSTALLDLQAHSNEVRQSFLPLSGHKDCRPEKRPVACNATLVAGEPAAVAADAERWLAQGFSTFKLKLGAGDDVAQVWAVREAVGPRARIRVDANAAWDLETAKRTLAALEPFEIELAEQPVATLAEMAELAADSSIPLAADESVASLDDAERAASAGACRYTGIKLSKVGGPQVALEIAGALPSYVSSALDGPVGIAAAAWVARIVDSQGGTGGEGAPPSAALGHGLATQRLFASTVAAVECELRGDRLHLPPGLGLGVEIDEAALAAHRLDAR